MPINLTSVLHAAKAGALLLLLGAGLAVSGCRGSSLVFWQTHPARAETGTATTTGEQSGQTADAAPDPEAPQSLIYGRDSHGSRDAVTGGFPEIAPAEESRPAGAPSADLVTIRFGFDDDELSSEARALLESNARFLRENPDVQIVLRGHTDQIGTDEYNISLGARRAQRVRDALIEMGIAASRIETVSFGRALPLEEGDSETAHAANRRVEFFLWDQESEN